MRYTLSAVLAASFAARRGSTSRISDSAGGGSPCGARYLNPCGAGADFEDASWAGAAVLGNETIAIACRNEDVVRLYRASDVSCGVGENLTSASEWLSLDEPATAAARVGDALVVSTFAVGERGNSRATIEIFPGAALPGAGSDSSATTIDVGGSVSVLAALANGDFVAGNRDGWVDQFSGSPWQKKRQLNVGAEVLCVAQVEAEGVLAVGTRDSGVFLYSATDNYPFAQVLAGSWISSVIAFKDSFAVADYEASQVRLVSLDGVIYRNLSVGLNPWRLGTISEELVPGGWKSGLAVIARDGSVDNVHLYTSDAIAACPFGALCAVHKTLSIPGPVEGVIAFGPEYSSDTFVHMGLAFASGGWVSVRSILGGDERAEVLTGVSAIAILALEVDKAGERQEFAAVGGRKVVRGTLPRARTSSGPNSSFELPPWKILQASGRVRSLAEIRSGAYASGGGLAVGTANGFVDLFDPFVGGGLPVRHGTLKATGDVRGVAVLDGGGLAALDVNGGDFPETEVLLFDQAAVDTRGAAIDGGPRYPWAYSSPVATLPATLEALTLDAEGTSLIVGGAFFTEVFDVPDLTNPPRLPRTKLASPGRAVAPLARGGIAAAGLPQFTALFDQGAVATTSDSAQEPYAQVPHDSSSLAAWNDGLIIGGSGGVFLVDAASLNAAASTEAGTWLRASAASDQILLVLAERRELLQISGSMVLAYDLATPPDGGKSGSGPWWAVGILVVVLAGGAGLWWFLSREPAAAVAAPASAAEGAGSLGQSLQPPPAAP